MKIFALGLILACFATASGYAQQKSDGNDTSLGDLARKVRAQKAKEHQPTLTITNDNIAGLEKSSASESGPSAKGKSSTEAAAEGPATPAPAHDAEYYRAHQRKLQDQLDTHKRELEVLQQKLGQNQMQYYPNPQDTLTQQYTRGDINKLTADIDAKKQQVAADEKALEDLRDQLRHEGGDPGWLR